MLAGCRGFMHELSIADALLERVQQEAARRSGVRVTRVGVRVGELSGVNIDALAFGFETLVRSTPWESLALDIEYCPRLQRCQSCGHEFPAPDSATRCPRCGAANTECIGGEELDLAYLEVEDA